MKEFLLILQRCSLFEGIAQQDLTGLLSCMGGRRVHYKKGETVFQEGDPAHLIGVVLTGSVQLIRQDYYGNRSILARIEPAQIFGESYAFSGTEGLPVSVQTEADSQILLLDSRRLSSCCSNACDFHNRVIRNLLHLVSEKNQLLHMKLQILSRRTTREKLMAYLLQQAKRSGSDRFTIPYDRQALADYLEVERSGLSAVISALRQEGILESEKNHFHILQNPPLK